MSNAKLKMSIGAIRFVGEGEEKWVETQLDKIIDKVPDLIKLAPTYTAKGSGAVDDGVTKRLELTTGSIASKLSCKTGPDLLKAAAAKLTLVDNKSRFSRKELLTEMQSASAFYKATFNKNLSASLKNLVKNDVLLETTPGTYSLSEENKNSMRSALA